MARTVQCVKLGREAEGLDYPTYPGELGKRIFENVSKEAWKQWLNQQTMLMNEYRLSPIVRPPALEPPGRNESSVVLTVLWASNDCGSDTTTAAAQNATASRTN